MVTRSLPTKGQADAIVHRDCAYPSLASKFFGALNDFRGFTSLDSFLERLARTDVDEIHRLAFESICKLHLFLFKVWKGLM